MAARVILDTNFLMIPGQLGVDIFEEMKRLDFPYELFIVSGTLGELDKIIEKDKNEDKIAARIAKALLKDRPVSVIETQGDVDSALVELSKEKNTFVATSDAELKRRLHGKKIILRQKKYIELV